MSEPWRATPAPHSSQSPLRDRTEVATALLMAGVLNAAAWAGILAVVVVVAERLG